MDSSVESWPSFPAAPAGGKTKFDGFPPSTYRFHLGSLNPRKLSLARVRFGRERRVAGQCELRGEEQFSFELPRIRARRFGQAERAEHQRRKILGRGEVSTTGGGAGAGVLNLADSRC